MGTTNKRSLLNRCNAAAASCFAVLLYLCVGCGRNAPPIRVERSTPVVLHLVAEARFQCAIPMDDGFRVLTVGMTGNTAVADGISLRALPRPGETIPIGGLRADVQRVELLGAYWPLCDAANSISFSEQRLAPGDKLLLAGFRTNEKIDSPKAFFRLPMEVTKVELASSEPNGIDESDSAVLTLLAGLEGDYAGFIGGPVIKVTPDGSMEVVAIAAGAEIREDGMRMIRAFTIPSELRDLYRTTW